IYTITLGLITNGVFSEQRHASFGTPIWSTAVRSTLYNHLQRLYTLNNQIQNESYILNSTSQQRINNDNIFIKEQDYQILTRRANAFDAITELANAANKIYRMDLPSITFENPT